MSSRASAGLMFFAGVQGPSSRTEPRGQGAELADHRAALRRVRELLPGREAHRELGHRPFLSQAGQHELPPQKVLKLGRVECRQVLLGPAQEAGEAVGEADARVAVPGRQHRRLREPVALLVVYRGAELFRRGVDSGLVLRGGGTARVAQPGYVQVAKQGPQCLGRG